MGPTYYIGQLGTDKPESKTEGKTTCHYLPADRNLKVIFEVASWAQTHRIIQRLAVSSMMLGHIGAFSTPSLNSNNGKLFGLHSSWDDQTAMRHSVPLIAICEFLKIFIDSTTHVARNEVHQLLNWDLILIQAPLSSGPFAVEHCNTQCWRISILFFVLC